MDSIDPVRFEGYLADIVIELKRMNANLGSMDSAITGIDEEIRDLRKSLDQNTDAIGGIKNSMPGSTWWGRTYDGPQQLTINFGQEEEKDGSNS